MRASVPAMGTEKKDQWDALDAEDNPAPGVSPEIARALLATNPALREGGMNTDLVIKQSAAAPGAQKPVQKAAAAPGASLADTAKQLEKGLADAQARFNADKKALLTQLTQWLTVNDPELRSPFTQQVLDQKK